MLALTRKPKQSIMIGNDIEITILEVKGDQVKLGISAPKEISVFRKEIYVQIEEENKQAVTMDGDQLIQLSHLFSRKTQL